VLGQTGTIENSYLFAGEQFDSTLDQYYLRARFYDQSAGRFTRMDSWQGDTHSPITHNKYVYADANPVNNIDPSGHMTAIRQMGAVSTIGILASMPMYSYHIGQSLTGGLAADGGFNDLQKGWVILAAMTGAGSKLLDIVTTKLGEGSDGRVVMYHGTSIDSMVSLLNGAPLSVATAMENKYPREEHTMLGFYLTPDLDAAQYFGQRRGGNVIQFIFTTSAFNAVKSGSIVQPIPPIGKSNQFPGVEMIVQPVVFPLFDSLRNSGQITATPAN
jgi:RHS repeat-associated protein